MSIAAAVAADGKLTLSNLSALFRHATLAGAAKMTVAEVLSLKAMAGINIVPITSRGRDGFHLPDRNVWERAITPRTRLVILCNPIWQEWMLR